MAKREDTSDAEKKNAFAAMLDQAINSSDKQQNTIAKEIGYLTNPNIMTMFKRGITRLPLDKVVPLAKAVDGDPASWLRAWFETYMPDVEMSDLERYLGFELTANEKNWVKGLRRMFHNRVPAFKEGLITMPIAEIVKT